MEWTQGTPETMPNRPVVPQMPTTGRARPSGGPMERGRAVMREAGKDPVAQAREILHLGFTVAPLAAGFDKFTDALVDWERYLDPRVAHALGMTPKQFMRMVGVIEMAAGVLVAVKPKWGAWVVAGWLGGIIGNLVEQRRYLDIALRDLGLMLGAIALGRLEQAR